MDIPYHMMSRSAIKAGGKRRGEGAFRVMAFVFSVVSLLDFNPSDQFDYDMDQTFQSCCVSHIDLKLF